jgi:protein SCO1/2
MNPDTSKSATSTRIVVFGLAFTMLLAGLATALVKSRHVVEYDYATVLQPPAKLVPFALLDQASNSFTAVDFKDHWNLVFFGFTHCPDVCPTTLAQLAIASKRLQQANGKDLNLRIVLVSVDPERDTPEVIAPYVAHFGDNVIGLTGSLEETAKLATSLGAFYQKVALGEDQYSMDHSAAVVVVNPRGEFQALFNAPLQLDALVTDMQNLIRAW